MMPSRELSPLRSTLTAGLLPILGAGAAFISLSGLLLSPAVAGAAGVPARAAKTVSLNESGNLLCTSKHGFTLNERGPAEGTISGTLYVHLTIASTSRVTAVVNIYPNGGSVSGSATASYHRGSSTATFAGTMSVTRGTGSFADARGSGLRFTGTIQRSNDAVTVRVSGDFSD
jgi:hypothetical protein